ncbi:uncharacterized protein METZ01_LOCUS453190, partial [marine metagenome]
KFFSKMISAHYDSPNNPSNAFGNIVKSSSVSLLNKALFFEIKTEIPGAQTWRIDRAGSAHAVELREPFLDHELVEFCITIPSQLKIDPSGFRKKVILQKLATELLPEKIVKRKKFPWGIPFYDFFKNEFFPVAETLLEKYSSHLNIDNSYVKKICEKASQVRDGQSKNTEIDDNVLRQILFLFNLVLWDQIFIKNDNLRNPSLSLDKFL